MMNIIYVQIATATVILFTIALTLGKRKTLSDYILVVWLFLFLVNVTVFFLLIDGKFPSSHPKDYLLELSDALVFLHGPIFLAYTISLTHPEFRLRWNLVLHVLPFGIVLILMSSGKYYSESTYVPLIETILKITSLLLYIVFVYLELIKHRKNVKNIFSNADQKYLGWLFTLSNGLLLLWLILFVTAIINIVGNRGRISYDGRVLITSTDVFLIFMCYFGVRQPSLYDVADNKVEDFDGENTGSSSSNVGIRGLNGLKYKRSTLTTTQAEEIHKKILLLMDTAKPYLDVDLTLYRLAEMSKTPPNHLSQVLNLLEGKNFFDFINFYRVEAVKKIINSNELNHFTLLGVAFECGFNSKAAFNRAFRKFTGITPSEFKNKRLKN